MSCDRSVTPHDFPQLETLVKKIVGEKQPFERLEMKKEDLLKMFEVCKLLIVYCLVVFLATVDWSIVHITSAAGHVKWLWVIRSCAVCSQ